MSSTQQGRRQADVEERVNELDAGIVGAGFAGLYALYKLRDEMGALGAGLRGGRRRGRYVVLEPLPGRAAIRLVGSTVTRSTRGFARNGSGANVTPDSKRCWDTSSTWPIGST
jgi:hypothetical protein